MLSGSSMTASRPIDEYNHVQNTAHKRFDSIIQANQHNVIQKEQRTKKKTFIHLAKLIHASLVAIVVMYMYDIPGWVAGSRR
jgi:ABC-type transporter MlaC component